jgi:ABC-type phosphate transport system ATPase subunit
VGLVKSLCIARADQPCSALDPISTTKIEELSTN